MALPSLNTERLLLRPFVAVDAPTVERLAGAREVADTTLTLPHPYPPGAAVGWIDSHGSDWEKQTRLTLAICIAEASDDIIGAISLAMSLEHSHGELGYWIGAGMWGRGYATEAARSVISYGFATLGLHRIQAHHFVRNPASGRVMEKIGMRREGVHRDAYRRWGRFEDIASYAVLAPEWEKDAD
jgi:RimJ/RimL family protein N-acetyltransferase